jgi:hypothetical protein
MNLQQTRAGKANDGRLVPNWPVVCVGGEIVMAGVNSGVMHDEDEPRTVGRWFKLYYCPNHAGSRGVRRN